MYKLLWNELRYVWKVWRWCGKIPQKSVDILLGSIHTYDFMPHLIMPQKKFRPSVTKAFILFHTSSSYYIRSYGLWQEVEPPCSYCHQPL